MTSVVRFEWADGSSDVRDVEEPLAASVSRTSDLGVAWFHLETIRERGTLVARFYREAPRGRGV